MDTISPSYVAQEPGCCNRRQPFSAAYVTLPIQLVVIFLFRSRTLAHQILDLLVLDATPEAIRIFISQVGQHELKTVLCLFGDNPQCSKRNKSGPDM